MKIWILIALFNLFLLGTAVMGVKVLPVKPVLKTIQNLPKVVRTLKKVTKIPALSKDHKKILKNVLRIRDGIKPDSWEKIEKSIDFFKQVSKLLNQANVSSSSVPIGWRDEEILICTPNTPGYVCHSPCEQAGSNYRWCYRKPNSSFDYCSCKVRNAIKNWIVLMKNALDSTKLDGKSPKNLVKPNHNDSMQQWIVISILGVLLVVLISGIMARIVFNYRKSKIASNGNENMNNFNGNGSQEMNET